LKSGCESGFENWGAVGPKNSTDRGTWHMIEGIIPEFLFDYTQNYLFYF